VCLLLFLIHTVHYARRVIAPPKVIYWWINYGVLELLPAALILAATHPQTRPEVPTGNVTPTTPTLRRGLRRSDSNGSNANNTRSGNSGKVVASSETIPLKSRGYGSVESA